MQKKRKNLFLHILQISGRTSLAALFLTKALAQTTGNWNVNSSSSWNTASNWTNLTNGQVPNAIGATVNLTFNITATRTITLDNNRTVGTLTIDDPTSTFSSYVINAGTTNPASRLIFDVATGSAGLNSGTATNSANSTIGAGITMNDPLVINWAKTNVNSFLNINGGITDGASSLSITKNGNGIVAFGNAANTYDGGTTINAGRIGAGNVAAFGTGTVTVNSNGQAMLATAGTFTNDFRIAGNGYSNTADAIALAGALRYINAVTSGTITLTGNARIGASSNESGTIAGTLTGGARNLEINSTTNASHNGTIILTGNATGLTGAVTVSRGTLSLGTMSNLGGSLIVSDNANLLAENVGSSGAASITGSLTLGNSASTTTGANLFIDPSTSSALQIGGNLTLNGLNTIILTGPITSNTIKVIGFDGTLTGSISNLSLQGGLSTYRPGTGFSTSGNDIMLNVVLGNLKWTGAANSNWNNTDVNWTDGSPTTFFNLDNVTFDDTAATNATFTTNLVSATNNDLVFTAKAAGIAGTNVTIEYITPVSSDSPLNLAVSGNAIEVFLATDSFGLVTSTASQIKALIEANAAASGLVNVAFAPSNDGSGSVVSTFASLALVNPTVNLEAGVSISSGDIIFNNSSIDYTVSGTGVIVGGGSLTKNGSGILTISTPNSYTGATALNDGTLRVGNASALGSGPLSLKGGKLSSNSTTARTFANALSMGGFITLGDATNSGALTFSGAATLTADTTLDSSATNTITHIINGVITDGADSFRLTKNGSAHLQLNSVNTYDGGTTISSARIHASNVGAFGSGTVSVLNGGQAFFSTAGTNNNNFEIEGIGWTEPSGNLGAIRLTATTLNGAITLTGDSRITAHGSTGSLLGNITESGGSQSLELSNYSTTANSTLTVSGTNPYTGGTTVKGAIVIANSSDSLGTGPISVQSNGTSARVTRLELGTNVVIENDITINSSADTGSRATVHSYAGSLTTPSLAIVNGDIEVQEIMGNGGHLASESGSQSVLRVMGVVNVTNPSTPLAVRLGTVELGGGGNYNQLNHSEGTLRLVASNGISPTATLSTGLSGISTFDLNGFSQTLTGLSQGSFASSIVNNNSVTQTLTLDIATSSSYGGTFLPGLGGVNIVKSGAGTLSLGGSSTSAEGSLVVHGGGLNLTGSLGNSTFSTVVNSGTVLSGEGSLGGNLTLNNSTLQVNAATSASLAVTGNLDTTGGVSLDITVPPNSSNPVTLITFSGSFTGNASNFTLVNAGAYRNPQIQINANSVTLTFDASQPLTWTGIGGSFWDINTTSNWQDPSLGASKFSIGDSAIFGNSGRNTISIASLIASSSININSSESYLFQGSGTLQAGSITKDGSGGANIASNWLISGPITLASGSLQFSPAISTTAALTTAISGAGSLVKGGEGILSITQTNTDFTGTTVISKGELTMGATAALGTNPIIIFGNADTTSTDVTRLSLPSTGAVLSPNITIAANSLDSRISSTGSTMSNATITKRGTGTLRIGHPTALGTTTSYITGTSTIIIEAGNVAGSSEIPFTATTTVTMGNSNTGTAATILELPANQTTTNDVVTLSSPIVLSPDAPNSEAIFRYPGGTSSGSLSYNGTIALNGRDIYFENTSTVNTPARLYNVQGAISGNGNVRIRASVNANGSASGAGRIRLTSTSNNWNGDFNMDTGMVQIGQASECIPNTARIIFSPGTSFTVFNAAETIRGLVGGAPTEAIPFAANYSVVAGSTLAHTLILSDDSAANSHVYSGTITNGTPTGSTIAIQKNGASTQTLAGNSDFSGNITINGGKLIGQGAQNGSGGVPVFGARANTRTITINNGGTLQFNSGNILSSNHVGTTTPTLVINSGGTVTNGGSATNNALNNVQLNSGTLTSTTGHTSSSEPFAPLYGAYNLNGNITSTGDSTISTSDPVKGWYMLKVPGDKITSFNVQSGTLTVSAPLGEDIDNQNIGSLSKSGAGTMVMSGVNFYAGSTTVSAGTLSLSDNAQLKFVLGASSGINNSITGAGTVVLDGDFLIDTTSADALTSGSWTLENVPSLSGAYGSTFTVVDWTDAGNNKWTKTIAGSKIYTFDETTGIVTLQSSGYASWAAINAGGQAANLDFDRDGVSNGVEFFMNAVPGFTTSPQLNASNVITWPNGGNIPASGYGTSFVVQTSPDLSTWADVPTGSLTTNTDGPGGTLSYTLTGSAPQFIRLKITVAE